MKNLILLLIFPFFLFAQAECEFDDLSVTVNPCDSNDIFSVNISFQHNQNPTDSFLVKGNGNNYGYFNYGDLPVTILNLKGDCQTQFEFVVIDATDQDCDEDVAIGTVCCQQQTECEFDDLSVTVNPCDSNDIFSVTISFQHNQNPTDSFLVKGNSNNYGYFNYSDLPVTILNLKGDCQTQFEFVVIDAINQDCDEDVAIGTVCCQQQAECGFDDLEVLSVVCLNGQVDIEIDFEPEEENGEMYDVYIDGKIYGYFSYSKIPLEIKDYPFKSNEITVTLCDQTDETCCESIDITIPCPVNTLATQKNLYKIYFVNNQLIVSNNTSSRIEVELFDLNGQKVIETYIATTKGTTSHMTNIPNGIYIARVKNKDHYTIIKAIKQY